MRQVPRLVMSDSPEVQRLAEGTHIDALDSRVPRTVACELVLVGLKFEAHSLAPFTVVGVIVPASMIAVQGKAPESNGAERPRWISARPCGLAETAAWWHPVQ
jgi:hypothetical protein